MSSITSSEKEDPKIKKITYIYEGPEPVPENNCKAYDWVSVNTTHMDFILHKYAEKYKKLKYITISINKRKQYISEDINIITDYFKDHKEFFTTCTIHKIIDIEFSVDLDILI